MRYLKIVLLPVVFAAIALVVATEGAGAVEVSVVPSGFENIEIGDTVQIQLTVTLEEGDPSDGITFKYRQLTGYQLRSTGGEVLIGVPWSRTYMVWDETEADYVLPTVNEILYQSCRDTGFASFTVRLESNSNVEFYNEVHSIPCSIYVAPTNVPSIRPLQSAICGDDNDVLDLTTQPEGVVLAGDTDWQSNSRTITFTAATNYVLEDSGIHVFTDAGDCEVTPEVPQLLETVCGSDNDIYSEVTQPENLTMEDSDWAGNSRSFTYTAADNYKLPDDFTNPQVVSDAGDCVAEQPVSPTWSAVCGTDNDSIELQAQPTGVNPDADDTDWFEGKRTITYSAAEGYAFPDETKTSFEFTDSGPCVTALPVPPVVTEVCGQNNDVVLLDDNQPANVVTESDGEWSEGAWNITFSAAENYVLPDGASAVYNLEDRNTPCPTDAPVPPVQTAICGPNNDLLTFPDQPEGVTLNTDTDWENNERTVTFAISDAFTTDGPTTFTFEDDDDPCPVIPIGKKVTVILNPSDGESLEGGSFALHATTASQTPQPAYIEGVVGADNTIVFEELMPGHYRLTVDAEGYEPIDELLMIGDGGEPETITIQVTALQILPTPTPEPTVEPTPEPTVAPTVEPTVAPTAEPTRAPVSDLPSTGSGSTGGTLVTGFALIAAAMLGAAVFVNRKSQA